MALQVAVSASQIALVPTGCAIEILDTTNYDAANNPPDPDHARANFFKKHIIVTNQDAIEYTMDSIDIPPTVDETIDAPETGAPADTNQYNFTTNDANGTFTIELFSLPTWVDATEYDLSALHIVYYNGSFYRTTIENNLNPPTSLIGWVVVDYAYLRTTTKYYAIDTVVVNCLAAGTTYQTLLFDSAENTYSVEVQDECGGLVITDESLYADNTESGHNIDDFSDYRTITIFKPSSSSTVSSWVMSSISALDPDEAISAPSSGNNIFNYNFTESDKDGLYTIAICSYPTWRDSANYTANPITVVYYNGVLYKMLVANTNQLPDVVDSTYWEVYTLDGTAEYLTRYCYMARVASRCIDILRCRERKINDAFCLISSDFCNDDVLCKNRKFLDAVKLQVLYSAVEYSMNRRAWDEVEKQFDLMYTICNC